MKLSQGHLFYETNTFSLIAWKKYWGKNVFPLVKLVVKVIVLVQCINNATSDMFKFYQTKETI